MAGKTDDIRDFYDRNFIQAFDLQGRDVTITIAGVRMEKIRTGGGGEVKSKAILKIEGRDLEFIPCKTDAVKVIGGMYGTKTKEWIGKRITIYPTTCQVGGETKDAIRVRPMVPKGGAAAQREPGED